MKKNKRLLALVMAGILGASVVSGCGSTQNAPASDAASASAASSSAAPADSKAGDMAKTSTALFDKPASIVFIHPEIWEKQPDFETVIAALNEYTKGKINVEATVLSYPISSLATQINLMLSSGEALDLIWSGGDISTMVSMNQLAPMDDLLDKYGQDIKSSLGELVNASKLHGITYGVPHNNCKIYDDVIVCNKAVMDELKLNLDNVHSLFDMDPIYEAVKKAHPEMVPYGVNNDGLSSLNSYTLGFGIDQLENFQRSSPAVWMGDKDLKIVNLIETDVYKQLLLKMRDWYTKGYLAKDGATSNESANSLFKSGAAFSISHHNYFSAEQNAAGTFVEKTTYGKEAMVKVLNKPVIGNAGNYNVSIAQTSKYKEQTMAWLNLFYSDAKAYNLLCRGMEGKNYKLTDHGTIDYVPPAKNLLETGYAKSFFWQFGNQALLLPFEDESKGDGNFYKDMVGQNSKYSFSPVFGFIFDSSKVVNESAAVSNVCQQYQRALECGSVDPEKELPKFIAKLKDAGVDKVVAEKQAQILEWSKNKK